MTVPVSLVFLEGQVGFMRNLGWDVHAVSSPGEELEQLSARIGATPHAVEMPRRITPFRDLRALVVLTWQLRRLRPTIVHAHTPKGGLLGMIAACLARVPVRVYHMRGLPLETAHGWRRFLLASAERCSCALAQSVICVSPSLRQVALRSGLCDPAKITVFGCGSGNGVDAAVRFNPESLPADTRATVRARLGIPANAVVVGYVGRLTRDKGILELVSAWELLRPRRPDLHLLLVGPVEDHLPLPEPVLRAFAEDPRIHTTGHERNTPPLYAAMDLLVLPTYREGFPNVLLEAAAMQLPVVATRVSGCVDAVAEGITGTLVPPSDAIALGAAIEAYLDDPSIRCAHGQAARVHVITKFAPPDIWAALHREYERLVRAQAALPSSRPL